MKKIEIIARTAYTVTIHRRDFAALVLAASPKKKPVRAARFTAVELKRMRKGTSPVRIWRERRRVNQRALADAAGIGVSYLAEIEGGKKPGSAAALSRLAEALGVRMEDLVRP
jgi:DNA-binding Xre family transcriptional regulator